jgi:hypothetical protein
MTGPAVPATTDVEGLIALLAQWMTTTVAPNYRITAVAWADVLSMLAAVPAAVPTDNEPSADAVVAVRNVVIAHLPIDSLEAAHALADDLARGPMRPARPRLNPNRDRSRATRALDELVAAVPTDTEGDDDESFTAIVGGLIRELGDVYRPRGVWMWLGSRNANLGGEVPAALMATPAGRVRVREEIDRLAGGPRIAQPKTEESR